MEAFQLRLWDGRIGRWLSPDPYGQYDSPYLGMGNNPISLTDPDGGRTENCCPDPPVKGDALREVVVYTKRRVDLDLKFVPKPPLFNFAIAPRYSDDYWWNKLAFDGSRSAEHNGWSYLINNDGFAVKSLGLVPQGGVGMVEFMGGGGEIKLFNLLKSKNLLQIAKNLRKNALKGLAPKEIIRVDIPKLDPIGNPIHGQKAHIHLKDKRAFNLDGTWKHGEGSVSNSVLNWINSFVD